MAGDLDIEIAPPDVVAAVVADITALHALPPLSDEERWQRQLDNEIREHARRQRDEERRVECERRQAEAAEQVRRDAAIAEQAKREQARRELRERSERQARERDAVALRISVAQHEAWQRNVEHAARNAVGEQQRQALIADLERSINRPPPPPEPVEPEVIVISEDEWGTPEIGHRDFNPRLLTRPRSWLR